MGQILERRELLSADFATVLPTQVGQVFVVDNWDNKVTQNDLGFDDFFGNTGATESIPGSTTLKLATESNGSSGGSLRLSFDFMGQTDDVFAGYFASLFGLTDTLVSLDGSGQQPTSSTRFPGYSLNTEDIYRDFIPLPDRSVELLEFDVRLASSQSVTMKIELKDENGFDVFTRRTVGAGAWQPITLDLQTDFTQSVAGNGDPNAFDWNQLDLFSLLVERKNVADGVDNPDQGELLIDNLNLVDLDGLYPDLDAIQDPATGGLDPGYEEAFLDYVRATSFLYFMDFASTDPRTGGIVQDRSSFADLMTIGGVGFQLSSYVAGAEQGYVGHGDAAQRVLQILRVLAGQPQGPDRVGTIGHEGFFYHFLGIDGLRRQNFDFVDTPVIESLNTVELSTIDTALAIAGVVTVGQYFAGNNAVETEIRSLADAIYGRVNWPFMLYNNPHDPADFQNDQFYLGWKPNEPRDESFGRFNINDAKGEGQYSSKLVGNTERPATLDFYTDEAILIALLAMGSPNPAHRVGREAWDALERDGDPFVKTFPGALFTYQFSSVWLDTERLGRDNHPTRPVDFFENTQAAIEAARQYVSDNPANRATWQGPQGADLWGLSAAEDPQDRYFAHSAATAALASDGGFVDAKPIAVEAEDASGAGAAVFRANASNGLAIQLDAGETRLFDFSAEIDNDYQILVRYSNDNSGPLETIEIRVDGAFVGSFRAEDTGDGGLGWNNFVVGGPADSLELGAGRHQLTVHIAGGDGFGIELDHVTLQGARILRPVESGVTTNYGVGSSTVHAPDAAIAGLWASARLDLNADGRHELLNPRFGFADAFTLDISDTHVPGAVSTVLPERSPNGPWANFTGFSIDHGPMLLIIDNYLEDQFIPGLFMSHPSIAEALDSLFDVDVQEVDIEINHGRRFPLNLAGRGTVKVTVLSSGDFDARRIDVRTVQFAGAGVLKSRFKDVDHDGDLDLLLDFRIGDTMLLDLYRQELQDDLSDGKLDSIVQSVAASLTGQTADDQLFEAFDELNVFHAKAALRALRKSRFR